MFMCKTTRRSDKAWVERVACAHTICDRHRHDLDIQAVRAEGWCGSHQGEQCACTL